MITVRLWATPRVVVALTMIAAASASCAMAARTSIGVDASNGSWDEARAGRIVRLPDGRRLNFRCSGFGAPTVLLESGFGATSMAWRRLAPIVAHSRLVCAYDRAGSGFSDAGPMPRDGRAIARDLDQGLRAARIPGPFILVGHSAGGLYIRVFAALRPADVVGLVLVDPSATYQSQRFEERFGPGAGSVAPRRARSERCLVAAEQGHLPSEDPALKSCLPDASASKARREGAKARVVDALRRQLWKTQISELDTLWTTTSEEAESADGVLANKPLIVLTADGTNAGAPDALRPDLDSLWRELHRELAALSRLGSERLVYRSSHMMMFDQPAAISDAIEQVAEVRPRRVRQP